MSHYGEEYSKLRQEATKTHYTTKEVAELFGVKVRSIHCAHSLNGWYHGVIPSIEDSGNLKWCSFEVKKALKQRRSTI